MIEQVLGAQLSGKVILLYDPNGLSCSIDAPVDFMRET
jgi:hypothetical protein